MKNKITGLSLLAILFSITTFATNIKDDIDRKVFNSFTNQFTDARDVSWKKTSTYLKATFKVNEQVMFAYFAPTGELLGVSRNILSTQLPINLQRQLKKHYSKGWITELSELANEQESNYYVTIENADQVLTLKSEGSNSWSVYKKTKKE